MVYTITVEIRNKRGREDVEVEIDLRRFRNMEDYDEQVEYIEKITMKQFPEAKKVYVTKENVDELKNELAELKDSSDMHPDETDDEYYEHEE